MSEIILKAECEFIDELARKEIMKLSGKIDKLKEKIKLIEFKDKI